MTQSHIFRSSLGFVFSQVQTNAFTVIFDERFSIPLDPSSLEECSLRFAAFGIDADERNISAGIAELKLSDLDLTIRPFNAWLYLQDVNKVCCDALSSDNYNFIRYNNSVVNSKVKFCDSMIIKESVVEPEIPLLDIQQKLHDKYNKDESFAGFL